MRYSTVLVKVSPMEEKLNRALESFRAAQEKLTVYKEDRCAKFNDALCLTLDFFPQKKVNMWKPKTHHWLSTS